MRIAALRGEIKALGAVVQQLRKAGLDNAAAEVLLVRKRAELDGLLRPSIRAMATEPGASS